MAGVDGIVSGIDTTALINAMVAASAVPKQKMESQLASFEKQKEAVAGFRNRLEKVSTALTSFESSSKLLANKVDTAGSKQFSVTADSTASPGSYAIQVENLAQAEAESSQGFADKDAAVLAHGTFTVNVGGQVTTVNVDESNDSISKLAETLSQVQGLSAYVLNTGSSQDPYKLVVRGLSVGGANSINFDMSGLSGGQVPLFNEDVTAMDAKVKIGGVTVHVASNTLNGAIPGLRIELLQPGTTEDRAVVSRDQSATSDKVKAMVDAYNEAINYHKTNTAYNAESNIKGPLFGESTTRRAVEDLGGLISTHHGSGTLTSLAEIGIKTERDGTLAFDETAFQDLMDTREADVVAFLTASDGPLGALKARIDDVYVDADNGALAARSKGIESSIQSMTDRIASFDDRLTEQADLLRTRFNAMEVNLSKIRAAQSQLTAMFGNVSLL